MASQLNMTDKSANGKPEARRVLLAPLPLPLVAEDLGPASAGQPGSLFYLSWAGWEFFLARRLGIAGGRDVASPLLLPDVRGPEEDFLAIDQLVRTAGELGAGLLGLPGRAPESLPGLTSAIRGYHQSSPGQPAPVLDDRSYLALWAVTEHQARQNDRLLAEAAAKERSMWAALKGEEPGYEEEAGQVRPSEPDRRTVYAWQCWRRLAGPLLLDTDIIAPNAPMDENERP